MAGELSFHKDNDALILGVDKLWKAFDVGDSRIEETMQVCLDAFQIADLDGEMFGYACELALVKCTKFPSACELVDLARTVAAVFQILNKPTDG